MTRRRLIIGTSIAVAVVGCWWCVVRPVSELRIAGISPLTGPSWRCHHDEGILSCHRAWGGSRKARGRRTEWFSLCMRSVAVLSYQREWEYPDSLAWMRGRDSIARELSRWGRPTRAPTTRDALGMTVPRPRGAAWSYTTVQPWEARHSTVALIVRRMEAMGQEPTDRFFAGIVGSRNFGRCGLTSPSVHIVTISEALAAIHRTIAEQIGF